MDIDTIQRLNPQRGDVLFVTVPETTPMAALHYASGAIDEAMKGRGVLIIFSRSPVDLKLITKSEMQALVAAWKVKKGDSG
jgi:hypothetical protein